MKKYLLYRLLSVHSRNAARDSERVRLGSKLATYRGSLDPELGQQLPATRALEHWQKSGDGVDLEISFE